MKTLELIDSSDTAAAANDRVSHPYWLIAIVATLAVLPIAFRGNPWGHDVNLHLRSWMDAAQQFKEGTLFPRWAAGANQGFGEPFFIFYPPLSRLIGVVLGLVLPWKIVSGSYIWLMLLLAGAAMWKCAREWLPPSGALLASLLFATNPYLLIIAYKRGNYADLLACALFPLLVWGGVRMGYAAAKAALPLSLAFAAIWLSDLPAAVVASYSLAALLLLGAIFYRSIRPLVFGGLAILSAFGGIAFFLLPAAWERRWVSIAEAVRLEWAPEHNFLFTHNNLPQYVAFNRGLSFIALFLIIVTALAALLARKLRQEGRSLWLSLIILAGISTFMMFSPSLVFYEFLPEMRYVEFPWRWLSPLCTVGALLVASVICHARHKPIALVVTALVVVATGGAIIYTTNWDSAHYLEGLVADAHSPSGYPIRFGDWSSPLGSQPAKLDKSAAMVIALDPATGEALPQQTGQIRIDEWRGQRKVFSVDSARPLLVKLRLLSYPAWQAKLNGSSLPIQTDPEAGQMLVPVPAGSSHVEIRFDRTRDRTLGNIVSVITILTSVPLMLWLRRRDTSEEAP